MSDCQNLTHRVNACVVQARLACHSSHGCLVPTPTFWRAGLLERLGPGTTQLPHLPTTISHTDSTVPGENGS